MREPTGQFPVVCPTLILCALAGALLGAMEWLFFATKPSFLMVFSAGQQLMSLLGAVGALGLLLLVAGAMLLTLASVFPAHRAGLRMLAASVVPAAAFTVLGLLLADNFTNTLFGFGSEKSHGLARLCYMALVLGCCAMLLVFCRRWIKGLSSAGPGHLAAAVVILCLCLAANVIVARGPAYPSGAGAARVGESTAYNVLVIGSDGVNAHNLSLYGYDRETSPFLEKLAGESLLALNAFTNSAHTSGMIASLLTGKLPIESGVIYSPDRLHGRHAYQSVPALLRGQYGYRTFQASFPKYADALDMNMKNAFDVVNGRAGVDGAMAVFGAAMLGDQTCLLLGATGERVVSRLLHVFYFQDAHDVYAEVTGEASGAPQITDDQRLSGLLDFIDSDDGPFFAHVHLMGTHGPYFRPEIRKFSARQEQNAEFMPDFYDDAILGFDHYMAEIYRELARRDLLQNTILVVYSDHGLKFATTEQVPLLFRIPGHAPGTIPENVESIDIPRTIIDVLGISAPEWVGGRSLALQALGDCHPVLSTGSIYNRTAAPSVSFAGLPSLGVLKVILGEHSYQWRLVPDEVYVSPVNYETAPPDCPAMSRQQARAYFLRRLAEAGHVPNSR